MRAAKKGKLRIGNLGINVSLYQGVEQFGLSTHLYHEDCGERIIQPRRCPEHEDALPIGTYNAIQINDQEIRIEFDERKKLLMTDASDWPVVGSLSLSKLPSLISSRSMVMGGLYIVGPQDCKFGNISQDAVLLRSLADRIRQSRRGLIVQVPVVGCLRYALLVSSGKSIKDDCSLSLIPLLFDEEVRNLTISPCAFDSRVDEALALVPDSMPVLTVNPLKDRIELWLKNRIKPVRRTRINMKEKVNA